MAKAENIPTRFERMQALRRQAALDAVSAHLSVYAQARAGRFVLFGAAQARADVDIRADFPPAWQADALAFARACCETHGLRADLGAAEFAGVRLLSMALGARVIA